MTSKKILAAGLSAVSAAASVLAGAPLAAEAAPSVAAAATRITRDGVSITYQRVTRPGTVATGTGPTRSDFDGDGLDDIAATARDGVIVRYSSQRWVDYFGNTASDGAISLGSALTSGDFNNDGYDDLVISHPYEVDVTNGFSTGGVWIVPGSAQGLAPGAIRHLNQGSVGVPGTSGAGDDFGAALAAGDLNRDGRADLAIGIPGKDLGDAVRQVGNVLVLLSNSGGVSTTGAVVLSQDTPLMPGTAEDWDRFGGNLAIGDTNNDGYGDLVIGSPGERSGTEEASTGMVNRVLGGPTGLNLNAVASATGADLNARTPGVSIIRLGYGGLALTDTDGDGRQDLIAGAPESTVSGHVDAGAAAVFRSTAGGFDAGTVVTQNPPGVPGDAEDFDDYGSSVAAGDTNNDGFGDVVIGVPGEDVINPPIAPPGNVVNAGVISMLSGSATGVTGGTALELSQGYEYTPGVSEQGDFFGRAVSVLNLDDSPGLDALVSASGERGTDEGGADPGAAPAGSVTRYSGDFRFMYGVERTTGVDVRVPGFDSTSYGYFL